MTATLATNVQLTSALDGRRPASEQHAVFAVDASGAKVLVASPAGWGYAISQWTKLDDARRAGLYPHVRYFAVRSMDDPQWNTAPASLLHGRPVVKGRGYTFAGDAARAAWKAFAPTFRSHYDKTGSDLSARTGVQGSGGWYYWPNGVTVAQGLRDLARICLRRGMIVQGVNGRFYLVNLND